MAGHRDVGTQQLPCRQLHARPAVPRHSREAAAAPAGGGDHSLATPPLSHPRRPGRGAGPRRGLEQPGQSREPTLCQTAGGANGRDETLLPRYPQVHVLHGTQWPQRKARSSASHWEKN